MAEPIAPLHPDATGLTVFRILPDGNGRAYSSVEFTRGWAGTDHFLRQLKACGFVKNSTTEEGTCYAVLDVLNADGDIVQDYEVPTAQAFRFIKRKLKLTVASEDAE